MGILKQFSQTECHHKYNVTAADISHSHHHSFDDCKVCHFTFGSYISPVDFAYKLNENCETSLFSLKQRSLFHFLEACIPSVLRQWKLGLTFSRYHFFYLLNSCTLGYIHFEDCWADNTIILMKKIIITLILVFQLCSRHKIRSREQ
jgi:hypothetical protein